MKQKKHTPLLLIVTIITILYSAVFSTELSQRTYTIKKNDNLWNLSKTFFDDNFKWRVLWAENKYIKDPHWIYPGNVLKLPLFDTISLVDQLKYFREDFNKRYNVDITYGTPLLFSDDSDRNVVIRKEVQFRAPFLINKKNQKGIVTVGNGSITGSKDPVMGNQLYSTIVCSEERESFYQKGEYISIYHPERYIKYDGIVHNVIKPVGIGKVLSVNKKKKQYMVKIVRMWDVISLNDRIGSFREFNDITIVTKKESTRELSSTVITYLNKKLSPYVSDYFIISMAKDDALAFGDIISVYSCKNEKGNDCEIPAVQAMVLRVDGNKATVVITDILGAHLSEDVKIRYQGKLIAKKS